MTKLNQLIAVEKGSKAQANDAITMAYHVIQKAELFSGIARNYEPKDEEGDQFPPESTRVQFRVEDLLKSVSGEWTRLLDVTATKDWSNTKAVADVVVDGDVLITKAPSTYLIWLEKQLVDLYTLVSKLPTLDQSFDWEPNDTADAWSTPVVKTHKTKKVPKSFVKYEATKEHPAQVEMFTEDEVVGYWNTVKFSGAIPQARAKDLLDRIVKLQQAVKFAREEANGIEVVNQEVGGKLFEYLLA